MNNKTKTPPFFKINAEITKPYALMDLDDTLFQTQRKIDAWGLSSDTHIDATHQLICASVNKKGEPLSFMTGRQRIFFNWLLASTELIVVTARDTQEIKRVKLPFSSWQVLTHGAVIVQPNGDVLPEWQTKMFAALKPLQKQICELVTIVTAYNQTHGDLFKLTLHTDDFQNTLNVDDNGANKIGDVAQKLHIYLAVKHKLKDHQALKTLGEWLLNEQPNLAEHFYIHSNANNLAILPHPVHKQHAVAFLLKKCLDVTRPSFGFGDSLADLPFLRLLDWYGMPNHGQLHDKVAFI